jgi:catechol 2,3-dioxygenase-like lactoylglutathione lyase family enzyme
MRLLSLAALALLAAAPASAQLAPPNAAGVTYGHVHLTVAEMDVHTALWQEHFGAQIVTKGPLTVAKIPNMLIAFQERAPTGPSQGSAMDHFGLKVRDMGAVIAKWRAAGLEVQSEFTGAEGGPNAYLLAPDGVRIELQEDRALSVPFAGYHVHWFTDMNVDVMNWYARWFGATIRPRGTLQTTADVPGLNLTFAACPDNATPANPCSPTRGRAIDHIGFEIDNLVEFVARMRAGGAGVEFEADPRRIDSIGLTIAYFTDPSGVRVELTEGYDLY